jgi:hypothetical protein
MMNMMKLLWAALRAFPWLLAWCLGALIINSSIQNDWAGKCVVLLLAMTIGHMFFTEQEISVRWKNLCDRMLTQMREMVTLSDVQDKLMLAMYKRLKELEEKYEPNDKAALSEIEALRQKLPQSWQMSLVSQQPNDSGTAG